MTSPSTAGPLVIIAGAGIGGLLLAQLLERAGISYHVFERAAKVKPLGAATTLRPTVLPIFEQLGMMEELERISVELETAQVRDEKLRVIGAVGMKRQREISGYQSLLFVRPDFYDLLLSRVPLAKISFGKKILKVEENEETGKVVIHCSDNSAYEGDILVGADGAYSAVRQNIYKKAKEEGVLPKSDSEDLIAGFTTMVGVTGPLDLDNYPDLKDGECHSEFVIGGMSHSWAVMQVPGARVAWACSLQYQDPEDAKRHMFKSSEWGSESIGPMLNEFRQQPSPYGGILGDIFDATPQDTISKVYLEHKMFETWFYKRSVLIGDACHKMLPAAGQGAVNALQDAVILANCLYDLKDNSQKSITDAFQSYYDQRYGYAKGHYESSKMYMKLIGGSNWTDKLARTIVLKYLPESILQRQLAKNASYRPQVNFLPQVKPRGSGPVLAQFPSKRYTREQQERAKNEKKDSVVV